MLLELKENKAHDTLKWKKKNDVINFTIYHYALVIKYNNMTF